MGWNSGYTTMEVAIINVYDSGALTEKVLDKIMEPYKGTDCDKGGSRDLKSKDGLGVEEIICKIMKPEEYEDVINNPIMYADFEEYKDTYMENTNWKWVANERAYNLFRSIWSDMWGIW